MNEEVKRIKEAAQAFFSDIENFRVMSGGCKYDEGEIHLRAFDLADVLWWSSDPHNVKKRALELHDDSIIGDRHKYAIWEQTSDQVWIEPKKVIKYK